MKILVTTYALGFIFAYCFIMKPVICVYMLVAAVLYTMSLILYYTWK